MRHSLSSTRHGSIPAATFFLVIGLLGAAAGCSDSPAESTAPGELPESGGEGSLTLKVVAEAEGEETGAGNYQTQFTVVVSDSFGNPVSGAEVSITGAFGTFDLPEADALAGTYSGVLIGYAAGSYTLAVSTGGDHVTGVTTTAPGVHHVTSPAANDSVSANTAINVRWTRPATADETRLETRDYDSDWYFGDQGTSWIPSVGNPPRTDQRVRVRRRNVQIAAGGLPGSQLSVSIRRTVEPVFAE